MFEATCQNHDKREEKDTYLIISYCSSTVDTLRQKSNNTKINELKHQKLYGMAAVDKLFLITASFITIVSLWGRKSSLELLEFMFRQVLPEVEKWNIDIRFVGHGHGLGIAF